VGGLEPQPCATENLELHGVTGITPTFDVRSLYGADAAHIAQLEAERPELSAHLHPELPYTLSEIVWGVRHEMARTLEDALSRRTRSLLLDSRASAQAAPAVARVMAEELGRDEAWQRDQLKAYDTLAANYRLEWRRAAR
jgi:glycerol-3-phosphate dehydrogenase